MANYFFIEINFLSELLIEIATDIRVVIGAEILIALFLVFTQGVGSQSKQNKHWIKKSCLTERSDGEAVKYSIEIYAKNICLAKNENKQST